jgi:hypothetical protein
MRLRHQGKRKTIDRTDVQPPDPGFTTYQCVNIYWLNERGITQRTLAKNLEVSQSTICRAIRRGRDSYSRWDEPRLNAMMGGLGRARIACDHPKIQIGEYVVCVECCVSGFDEIDALQVTAADLRAIEGIVDPPKETQTYAQKKFGGRKRSKK